MSLKQKRFKYILAFCGLIFIGVFILNIIDRVNYSKHKEFVGDYTKYNGLPVRLKVLLITTKKTINPNLEIIGNNPYDLYGDFGDFMECVLGDSEAEDFIELMSASNIPYEVKFQDIKEIKLEDLISQERINFSTVILALPVRYLTYKTISALKIASYYYGVSIIASYDRVNYKIQEMFGISKIKGKTRVKPGDFILITDESSGIKNKILLQHTKDTNIAKLLFNIIFKTENYPIRKRIKDFLQDYKWCRIKTESTAETIATINNNTNLFSTPVIIRNKYGDGVNYYFAMKSDIFLDKFDFIHKAVREIITVNSGNGMVFFKTDGMMILRMDDPGGAQNIHLQSRSYNKLRKNDWLQIYQILNKYEAILNPMYVSGWVDDGDNQKGSLFINHVKITSRIPGEIYDSKDVVYVQHHKKYDLMSEYSGLLVGVKKGLVNVESHGFTHMEINRMQWSKAIDRYTNPQWYREFRHLYKDKDVSGEKQFGVMTSGAERIKRWFGVTPTTITPSGHEKSLNSEIIARKAGFKLFCDQQSILLKYPQILRNDKIQTQHFDIPDKKYSKAGYPVIGYFHDRDIALNGVSWLEEYIIKWGKKGIKEFISFRELVGYLFTQIDAYRNKNRIFCTLNISRTGGVDNSIKSRYFSSHSMKITLKIAKNEIPVKVEVDTHQWNQYEFNPVLSELYIYLPKFAQVDSQRLCIYLTTSSQKEFI